MLKIRLQRRGNKGNPVYGLVVVDSKAPRDGGNVVEYVGHYSPQARGQDPLYSISIERIEHWLSVGAQPTDTVANIIRKARKIQSVDGKVQAFAA